MRILTHDASSANRNCAETIQDDMVAHDSVFGDMQVPWNFDCDRRADACRGMYIGSKPAQEPIPPAVARPRTPSKERPFHDIPKHAPKLFSSRPGAGATGHKIIGRHVGCRADRALGGGAAPSHRPTIRFKPCQLRTP